MAYGDFFYTPVTLDETGVNRVEAWCAEPGGDVIVKKLGTGIDNGFGDTTYW